MGSRKHNAAEVRKAEKRQKAIAILRDCPTSPRKMRLVADMVRGVEINRALGLLRYSKKEASRGVEKLLRSAIANWEAKNEGARLEETPLCVKEIYVDSARQLKRIQPAPQGRAHRIRKRSNHVTIIVDRFEPKGNGVVAAIDGAKKGDSVVAAKGGAKKATAVKKEVVQEAKAE